MAETTVIKVGENEITLPTPREIKKYLDQYVIGQDEAKRTLSVAVYNHYKRVLYNRENHDIEIGKGNVMLIGETGSGKTLLVKTIAKLLNVPCYIQDSTKLTESGYAGSDVEECLAGLLRQCNYNTELASMGIVVLDEGDKLKGAEKDMTVLRDPAGEGVQQGLLKIVEGDMVGVPPMGGRKHPEQPLIYLDTTNILFILSGAFVGLDSIIRKRMGKQKIGFESDSSVKIEEETIFEHVTHEDVKKFGFIPEFIGRFPIIAHVNRLDISSLKKIFVEPKDSLLKQYTELFKMDGIDIEFTDDALDEIASLALSLKTGARALRAILDCVMMQTMFDAPSDKTKAKYVIDKDFVIEKTSVKFRKDVC